MVKKFAITLHKNGVGKTTTTNLAGTLVEQGERVLLIDCDSQGDLSSVFLNDHEKLPHTVADLFADTGILAEDLIQPTPFAGISIIPADRRLERFERTYDFKHQELTRCLADAIAEVADHFDYVLAGYLLLPVWNQPRPVPFSRDSTALAAARNRTNGFHKSMFLPKREPSVSPVAAGTWPHEAARGLKPGPAADWVAPVRPR